MPVSFLLGNPYHYKWTYIELPLRWPILIENIYSKGTAPDPRCHYVG